MHVCSLCIGRYRISELTYPHRQLLAAIILEYCSQRLKLYEMAGYFGDSDTIGFHGTATNFPYAILRHGLSCSSSLLVETEPMDTVIHKHIHTYIHTYPYLHTVYYIQTLPHRLIHLHILTHKIQLHRHTCILTTYIHT